MIFRAGILIPISRTLFKEFFSSVLIIFLLSFSVFLLIYISPGDDLLQEYLVNLEENSSETIEDVYSDKYDSIGLPSAYFSWFSASVTGNFGISSSNGLPVLSQVIDFTINTLYLTISALLISMFVTFPIIIMGVTNRLALLSRVTNSIIRLLSFLPLFWLAYILIYISTVSFDHYPLAMDYDEITVSQFVLPVILLCFGSGVLVEMIQQLTYEIKRVLNEEYILCARAKGASVFKHLFKEGIAFPLLNLISNRIAYLFGATIIIEQIFNWPGIGRLLWQATQDRDIPLLLGAVIVSGIVIRTAHFFSRLIYVLINPRASHE